MVSIPRARARSQTAFTGVIWPVMLIMCEMRISRVRSVIPFSNAAVISLRFFGGIGTLMSFSLRFSRFSRCRNVVSMRG